MDRRKKKGKKKFKVGYVKGEVPELWSGAGQKRAEAFTRSMQAAQLRSAPSGNGTSAFTRAWMGRVNGYGGGLGMRRLLDNRQGHGTRRETDARLPRSIH